VQITNCVPDVAKYLLEQLKARGKRTNEQSRTAGGEAGTSPCQPGRSPPFELLPRRKGYDQTTKRPKPLPTSLRSFGRSRRSPVSLPRQPDRLEGRSYSPYGGSTTNPSFPPFLLLVGFRKIAGSQSALVGGAPGSWTSLGSKEGRPKDWIGWKARKGWKAQNNPRMGPWDAWKPFPGV
jgi:hypothetical protein